ncbi:hypothetical protein FRAAL4927 [Frankia alni ACN14a]|uniref:Uncharacterized protein n=1 Tax=Frankia alni (strain DSM 45986 / CECT 9034 / ACN14a) TaxID=326424 RepID=Q0RG21_FRAAA|nr:hypothetical protein FRAAL4927 [Frankia alni ACN14a]
MPHPARRSTALVIRGHIDFLRVASAVCLVRVPR